MAGIRHLSAIGPTRGAWAALLIAPTIAQALVGILQRRPWSGVTFLTTVGTVAMTALMILAFLIWRRDFARTLIGMTRAAVLAPGTARQVTRRYERRQWIYSLASWVALSCSYLLGEYKGIVATQHGLAQPAFWAAPGASQVLHIAAALSFTAAFAIAWGEAMSILTALLWLYSSRMPFCNGYQDDALGHARVVNLTVSIWTSAAYASAIGPVALSALRLSLGESLVRWDSGVATVLIIAVAVHAWRVRSTMNNRRIWISEQIMAMAVRSSAGEVDRRRVSGGWEAPLIQGWRTELLALVRLPLIASGLLLSVASVLML